MALHNFRRNQAQEVFGIGVRHKFLASGIQVCLIPPIPITHYAIKNSSAIPYFQSVQCRLFDPCAR